MKDDAAWYEAAFVVGVTNALNVAAEGMPALAAGVLSPVDETCAAEPVAALFAEISAFYASAEVPAPFRLVALDPGYARDLWEAVQRAFAPNRLPRPLKEALAFAVSLTTRSSWGTQFHGAELKRLGTSERGLLEVLGVTQMFSSYTKIADTLQLESDMGGIAPVDGTPAPG